MPEELKEGEEQVTSEQKILETQNLFGRRVDIDITGPFFEKEWNYDKALDSLYSFIRNKQYSLESRIPTLWLLITIEEGWVAEKLLKEDKIIKLVKYWLLAEDNEMIQDHNLLYWIYYLFKDILNSDTKFIWEFTKKINSRINWIKVHLKWQSTKKLTEILEEIEKVRNKTRTQEIHEQIIETYEWIIKKHKRHNRRFW